jgi:FAD/FMN-containing dehydrogenase
MTKPLTESQTYEARSLPLSSPGLGLTLPRPGGGTLCRVSPPQSSNSGAIVATMPTAPLARALHREIDGEVRFDRGTRALCATDASNYRQVPIGAVVPRTIEAVVATVALCREHGAPIFARGGGTSLAGQTCKPDNYEGEHGDGQSRADLHEIMFGPELVVAFDEFKTIWDPDRAMNPARW